MLRLSKKTMFVLEAVLDIACNARPDPVQSKDIALRQGIPQRYLEGALQHLVRAGILRGVRGPKGGYRLARERRRITVAEVVRLMEEMDDLDTELVTSPLGRAVVQPLWRELRDDMLDRLEGVSLEDLYRQVRQSGVADSTAGKSADFDI
ncbi:MAG: Rrf2 family transcriptional regulator [Alphaproteobacteria bacterium]